MDTVPLHDTAGSHLIKQVPSAYLTGNVSSVLSALPGKFKIFILDTDERRLRRERSIERLSGLNTKIICVYLENPRPILMENECL